MKHSNPFSSGNKSAKQTKRYPKQSAFLKRFGNAPVANVGISKEEIALYKRGVTHLFTLEADACVIHNDGTSGSQVLRWSSCSRNNGKRPQVTLSDCTMLGDIREDSQVIYPKGLIVSVKANYMLEDMSRTITSTEMNDRVDIYQLVKSIISKHIRIDSSAIFLQDTCRKDTSFCKQVNFNQSPCISKFYVDRALYRCVLEDTFLRDKGYCKQLHLDKIFSTPHGEYYIRILTFPPFHL